MQAKVFMIFMFFIIPFTISILSFIHHSDTHKSDKWPKIKAKVTEVKIQTRSTDNNLKMHSAFIVWEYIHNGKLYEHRGSASLGNAFRSRKREEVEEYTMQFPIDSEIDVYINPKNPAMSTFEVKKTNTYLILSIFLLIFSISSLSLIILKMK